MGKELKGLGGKVAIHCTTPEEVKGVGSLLGIKKTEVNWAIKSLGQELGVAFDKDYSGVLEYYQKEGYTILPAADFIALNTDQPETQPFLDFAHEMMGVNTDHPDKERELLEKFRDYMKISGSWAWDTNIDKFLTSIRTPAFSLQCFDGVATDPDAMVYREIGYGIADAKWAFENPDYGPYFTTEAAAVAHRLQNTPAIKLSDMEYDPCCEWYVINEGIAHNLVNERINGTK
jgi:hypothetical protein